MDGSVPNWRHTYPSARVAEDPRGQCLAKQIDGDVEGGKRKRLQHQAEAATAAAAAAGADYAHRRVALTELITNNQ